MISRLLVALAVAIPLCAQGAEIEIGPGVCETLVGYVEPPGVEYRPGVDATGNAVAPAGLTGTPPLKVPPHIVIPVSDYLAGRLSSNSAMTSPSGVLQPQAFLGTLALDDTRLTFNGQPVGADIDGDLGLLCEKALHGAR